jgi:hypothetical protein
MRTLQNKSARVVSFEIDTLAGDIREGMPLAPLPDTALTGPASKFPNMDISPSLNCWNIQRVVRHRQYCPGFCW